MMFPKAEYGVCGTGRPAWRQSECSTRLAEEERLKWLVREKIGAKLVASGADTEGYVFAS